VLLVVVAVHLVNPFRRGVQAALLLLVLVHALLGVRAVLLDFGLPVRGTGRSSSWRWCSRRGASRSGGRGGGTSDRRGHRRPPPRMGTAMGSPSSCCSRSLRSQPNSGRAGEV